MFVSQIIHEVSYHSFNRYNNVVHFLQNKKKEEGYKKYNPKVTSFKVRGEIDDGIFEPGETVVIEEVEIVNDGDLTLPEGCCLQMTQSPHFVPLANQTFSLPEIKRGEKLTAKCQFKGTLVNTKNNFPRCYREYAEIFTSITLLGREFRDSVFHKRILVQYPVRVSLSLLVAIHKP